ncbi:MAG: LysM peptidoglycan-binding domain-containing protein [Dehalococcoidia bacterium]|nr:LysM peptidoglycan-binding domain-containing protein [Dehalococcoidia bacterium]
MASDTKPMQGSNEARTRDVLHFVVFLAMGISLAVVHWLLAGPPTLPSLDLDHLQRALTRSEVSSSDAISVARAVGWAVLLYLGFSTALRLLVGIACRLSDGSAWSVAALRFTDVATLPAVRRVVDGAIIGIIVLGFWMRERTGAEAGGMSFAQPVVASVSALHGAGPDQGVVQLVGAKQASSVSASYGVREGESLWSIARRLYGDGSQYVLLQENQLSPTGESRDGRRQLSAGSVLSLALPTPNLWVEEDVLHYRVQAGDSLWRIAETFLDDGFRWIEIWELNRGQTMTDGRSFHDADLIHPGWVLALPVAASQAAPPEAAEEGETALPVATATPMPVEPTPVTEPTQVMGERPVAPATETDDTGSTGGGFTVPLPGHLPVLATAAGLASTYLIVRGVSRRLADRRSNPRPARNEKRPTGDAGRVVLAARALMAALDEAGFSESRLSLVREAARYQDCHVECPPGDADALAALHYDLGRILACGVDAAVLSQTEVRFRLSRFQRLAGLLLDRGESSSPLLVPVGGADGGVYYLNLAACGALRVAGAPEQSRLILTSWLQTLAATCRPDDLSVLPDSGLEEQLIGPATAGIVPPHEQLTAAGVLDELEDIILAREKASSGSPAQSVVGLLKLDHSISPSRVETVQSHGLQHNLVLVMVVEEDSEALATDFSEVVIAFSDSTIAGQFEGWDGEGDLILVRRNHPPLSLYATEVRKDTVPAFAGGDDYLDDLVLAKAGNTVAPPLPVEAWESSEEAAPAEETEESDATSSTEPSGQEGLWADEAANDDGLFEQGARLPATQLGLEILTRPASTPSNGKKPDTEVSPVFAVQALGRFEVSHAGVPVEGWKLLKSRELLAYLLCRGGSSVPREEPIEALWPDALPEQMEKMLYNAMYSLRVTLKEAAGAAWEAGIFPTRPQVCVADVRYFSCDTDAFNAHLRRAAGLERGEALVEYERGLALYKDDLFASEFEWSEPFRQDYRRRFVEAAKAAGKLAQECRDADRAIRFYEMALERAPIDEDSARGLMRAYAARGDVNGVKKVYRVLGASIREELEDSDARPLPDTELLFEELTRQPRAHESA